MRGIKLSITLGAALIAVAIAGCDLDVPDLNNPGIDDLTDNPTPAGVTNAATGLLIGNRAGTAAANGYVAQLGILGREAYQLDPSDPRYVAELLGGSLSAGSPFGGGLWLNPYANIRNSNVLLAAVDKVAAFSPQEVAAIKGFAKTIQALDLMGVHNTRDTNGIVLDADVPFEELGPIERDITVIRNRIAALLDDAKVDLMAGGDEFPFPLSPGYAGFDTPATFLTFNRALRARLALYQENYAVALTALDESFYDPAGSLTLGVYHSYSTGSGDLTNALLAPTIFAHPALETEAQNKLDGTPDNRFATKVRGLEGDETPGSYMGLSSDLHFTMYSNPSASVPIIRNEELILIHAEASYKSGAAGLADAIADLNDIRVRSGGLELRDDITAEDIEDELLYNRRYSLLFEGGHRWIDLRRFDRIDDLPLDLPGHTRNVRYPLPLNECNARPGDPACPEAD